MLIAILIFICVLTLLVLVHEWGHFIVARKAGIKVEEFGFGFPPRMLAWKGKATTYTLNWLPLGGFVKLKGEDGNEGDDSDSFSHKTVWTRALVVVAGVVMNMLLAIVLFTVGYVVGAPETLRHDMPVFAHVSGVQVEVTSVLDGSSAMRNGFKQGDVVVASSYQQSEFKRAVDVSVIMRKFVDSMDNEIVWYVERGTNKQRINISIPREQISYENPKLGVGLREIGIVSYPLHRALWEGTKTAFIMGRDIVRGIIELVAGIFVLQGIPSEVAGPIGIAAMTGEVAHRGILYMIQFVAMLSVNLAVLNLVPFPALDGGRLLFIIIEAVSGKKVHKKFEQSLHVIGFGLLMVLIIFVTVRDVGKLSGVVKNILKL